MLQHNPQRPQSVFNTQSESVFRGLVLHRDRKINPPLLYAHQVEAVLSIREYFNPTSANNTTGSNIALAVMPTGSGKTGVAVLASYVLNASCVLVITPSLTISRQIDAAYDKFLEERGLIDANQRRHFIPSKKVISRSNEIQHALAVTVMITNAHKIGGQSRVAISDIPRGHFDLVIVDEAHHYPARTWKLLVDHFADSKRLFLTATPEHRGQPILDEGQVCYHLNHQKAVDDGIIRKVEYDEIGQPTDDETSIYRQIAKRMEYWLNEHDLQDNRTIHQGMVLAQTREDLNAAKNFCSVYQTKYGKQSCEMYVGETRVDVLRRFQSQKIRTLVIVGKLLEGFDHKQVSVLGIVRNVAPTSRVLFAQFVGRALRKSHSEDCVVAQLVTHQCFQQRVNFERFDTLADKDPPEED